MTLYNEVTTGIAITVAVVILWLIRKRHLGVYHTMLWIGAVIGLLLFGIFPVILDWVGSLLGVSYPPVLLVVASLCVLLVKMLTMDIELTRHESKLRILNQRMAAYEAELQELKEKQQKKEQ